ncbi:potassium channel family protein [Chloroflexota bacterium]
MMHEDKPVETIRGQHPGDVMLRRRRKHRARLRPVPNIPAFLRFCSDLTTQTPLIPVVLTLVVLLLIFSAAIYAVEHQGNQSMNSFGATVWWSISAMQTMGFNDPGPITSAGRVLGSIWALLGTIMFFGAIIAGLTAYFLLPRRRPSRDIVNTIQYNLERLEDLSVSELKTLKESTDAVINIQIESLEGKAHSSQAD